MDPKSLVKDKSPCPVSRSAANAISNNCSMRRQKPIRRDPEKRRQQNIQAQKKYREKQKKHLDRLKILAATVTGTDEHLLTNLIDANSNSFRIAQSPWRETNVFKQQNSCHHPKQNLDDGDSSSLEVISHHAVSNCKSPVLSQSLDLWDSTICLNSTDLTSGSDVASDSVHWAKFMDCGCLNLHVQVSSSVPRQYRDITELDFRPEGLLPDPYPNTLRVERRCLVQAISSNCVHMGITMYMLCDENAASPFFRAESGADVIGTVQSLFKVLKHDVRPLKEQITIRHSPVMDVLPFPTLRKNLLKNIDVLNADELYYDMFDGLMCWGGAGVGLPDRNCATGSISTGMPWDSRSWEARPWFLRKYWTLLGGEDGELVRHSEWWRSMRGEETDPWLAP